MVRCSYSVEDFGDPSTAGRFESVVGVHGLDVFHRAVAVVVASREQAAAARNTLTGREPLAVLVQPLLGAGSGGVLFGSDAVSGREDRRVVAAVQGEPDELVRWTATRYELDGGGHAELAARTADVSSGPQYVEWAPRR